VLQDRVDLGIRQGSRPAEAHCSHEKGHPKVALVVNRA
jgi:hypothetical protein